MKRVCSILALLSIVLSTSAYADPYDDYGNHYYEKHHRDNWVAPLLGGVIISAILTDSRRPRYSEPRPPYAPLVCRNIYIRDRYGNYVLDQDGRAIFTQRCWYQQDY